MTLKPCARETEVAELVKSGRWLGLANAPVEVREVAAHAQSCRRCADLVLVLQAFGAGRTQAMAEAPVGEARMDSPGLLWWRAQLRRRNAAVERIARPVSRAQIFALAVNVLVCIGVVIVERRHVAAWVGRVAGQFGGQAGQQASPAQELAGHLAQAAAPFESLAATGHSLMLVAVLGALALLGGVAVYLATEKQ
jgi:hypothetical protein